jgi:hypothetical protein
MERDEEVRTVAGSLRLSEESVRYLLAGREPVGGAARQVEGAVADGSPTSARATVVPGGAHELEVRFLAGCLAQPEAGREALASIDEGFFAAAETRAALRRVKARLAAGDGGALPADDQAAAEEGAEAFAEVVVRAGRERFTATVVRELYLRLQEAQASRLIARLKVTMKGDDTGMQAAELARWEGVRRRLREALRAIPVEDDSGQR